MSTTALLATQLGLFLTIVVASTAQDQLGQLVTGFQATPNPSVSTFQPLLNGTNNGAANFSFGFLRLNRTQLLLSVVHVPSLTPLWQANPTAPARWSDSTRVFFNGSLVISDPHSGSFWSSGNQVVGDRVVLLNNSNLQVQRTEVPVWESFEFPTNTLVENQNFSSNMTLVNGRYNMKLGDNFMAMYAKFDEDQPDQIYWKHKALEAKAHVIEGAGPVFARVNSDGFLGMYQTGDKPVDVQAFNTFQRSVNGFLLVRLEPDGNLKGYYWDSSNWVLDYQAITDACQLPSACGPYGLCTPGSGCSCLDNRTEYRPGGCLDDSRFQSGEYYCGGIGNNRKLSVLRREGVDLPFKELMDYRTASSREQCEGFCENNCSCWGTVYNNVSGFCYYLDYPIQTMLGVGDESKAGYFKVVEGPNRRQMGVSDYRVIGGVLGGALLAMVGGVGCYGYRIWKRRRSVERMIMLEGEGGVSPCPYKDLGSASFRSIEMCGNGK